MGNRGFAWAVLGIWMLILVVVVAIGAGAVSLFRSDRLLPGIQVLDMDLGNTPMVDAANRLAQDWGARTVSLTAGSQTWQLAPAELGVTLDVAQTVRRAHAAGRDIRDSDDVMAALARLTAAMRGATSTPMVVEPVWEFDLDTAAATLREIGASIAVTAEDATVSVNAGRIEASPSVTGRVLDLSAALTFLAADPWGVVLSGAMPLTVIESPPAIADAREVAEQADRLLTNRISVALYDPLADVHLTWKPDTKTMAGWFVFTPNAEFGQIDWEVASDAVAHSLDSAVGDAATDQMVAFGKPYAATDTAVSRLIETFRGAGGQLSLRVYHEPREHLVQAGESLSSIAYDYGIPYPWIQAENPDLGDTLLADETIIIPSPDALIPLPPVEGKRVRVSITEQRMWAYEGGQLKWEWPVSTGIPSSPTSPGIFQVQTHEPNAYAGVWDLWMPSFLGIYQPAPNQAFMNGFHGFPSRDQRQLLWTSNLGRPVTYGCILLSTENATALFDWAEEGVIVEVAP